MNRFRGCAVALFFVVLGAFLQSAVAGTTITNNVFAVDTDGNPIYAQGGGVFKFPDPETGVETYYWYGVKYNGAVDYQNNPAAGDNDNFGFAGFSCYSSTNLVDWKFENLSVNGLGGGWVGRMGVCYNENTEKYVLLSQNYPGIMFATCDTPNGIFQYHHTQSGADLDFIVNNGTGDQTLFIDDDGTPYLIASSVDGRSHLYVLPLRESDYLEVLPGTEVYSGSGREGNCMFKYNGKYYFCSSDLYGWNSSRCYVLESVGGDITGPYLPQYVMNRSILDYCHVTQTGFFVTVEGTEETTVLFVGDRWAEGAGNGIGFNQWCPLSFNGTKPTFESVSVFDLDAQAGTWSVAPGNNYILNPAYEADRVSVSQARGWTSTGSGFGNYGGNGHVPGSFFYHHYSGSAYTATTYQRVTGLPNGTYRLSAWYKSSGGQAAARIFARNYGGSEMVANINTAQSDWTQVTISNIEVTDRECEVGLYSNASGGQYVDIDDWSLTLVEAAPPPPPGKQESLWEFDETGGTTATDSITNQHVTLVNGATWTSGRFDNAVALDGSNDYLSFPSGIFSSLENFTFCGWFNLDQIDTWSRIFDFGSSQSVNMFLTPRAVDADGTIRFAITASGNANEEVINGVMAPSTGAWHHFAITLNGSTGILYVDGVEVGRNMHMTLTPSDLGNTTQNWIGRSQYPDPYLDGRVDDFRVYSHALASTEVAALAAGITPPDAQLTELTAEAISSTQVNLSWTDNTSNEEGFRIDRSLDGTTFEQVAIALANATNYSDSGLAPQTMYTYRVHAFNAAGDTGNTNTVEATTLEGPASAPTGLSASANGALVELAWNAVPGALGYRIERSLISGGPYTIIADGMTGEFYTDTSATYGGTYYYVISSINDYGNSSLSSEASATTGEQIAHWRFNESSGTTAIDRIGAQNAMLNGGASWGSGRFGNGVVLDGSDEYVSLPSGVLSSLEDYTVAGWFYLNSLSTWSRIFDFGTGESVNMFLTPQPVGSGNPIRFAITSGGNSSEQVINGNISPSVGAWHHFAVTLNGTLGVLYLDGVEVGRNSNMSLSPSDLGNTTQNWIGRSQYPDPYLNGRVDDFRIYNYGLSSSEVATLAAGTTAPATPTELTADAASSTQINLSWAAGAGADSYQIKRATSAGGPYETVAVGVTDPRYVDGGLESGTTYYYVISSVNVAAESADSAEVSAIPFLPPAPMISTVNWADGNFILGGTNAILGSTYHVLTTTNLTLPMSNWVNVVTDQFSEDGTFLITNEVNEALDQQFFIIQLQE